MTERSGPYLEVLDLSKVFHPDGESLEVLREINLEVDRGGFAAIIGPSGSGKSTLFNILAGLIRPDQGRIRVAGLESPDLKGRAAYMQQKDLLLPWRTVLDNVVLGLEIKGVPKKEARRRAEELLPVFGLEGFAGRRPHELSGGMRQRAALMRTVLCQKEILLLDEPFGALDAITRRTMQQWLLSIWSRFRPTILLVTHDVEEALLLADRLYILTARPGSVKGTVTVNLDRPRTATQPEMVRLREHLLDLLEAAPEDRP
ncbi:MAG: ABC transporter ATP-binding protein [Thermodesulfobacteriota bacterium]